MQRTVTLPITAPKCVASTLRCSRAEQCASHAVAYVPGRPIEDFSIRPAWFAVKCPGFVSFADAQPQAAAPRVHKSLGSA